MAFWMGAGLLPAGAGEGEAEWRDARGMMKGHDPDVVRVRTAGAEANALGAGQVIRLEYALPALKAEKRAGETEETSVLTMGNAPQAGAAGKPILPVAPCCVALPAGMELEGIEVVSGPEKEPSGTYKLAHGQSQGMTATIVAIEDILSAEYYRGVDDAETLRNFIRDAYNTWKTDFVLLGGDTAIVPMRELYCYNDAHQVFEQIPSDLYYQCLDGNYNLDNDDKWGEATDGEGGKDIDLMSEVYLGRASVENVTEMANFVYKTLLYETQSEQEPYLRNHLLAGQSLGDVFGPGVFAYGKSYITVAGHSSNVGGYATTSFDSCPLFKETTMFHYDDYLAGRPLWKGTDMIAKINSGQYSIINHCAHGSRYLALGITNKDVAKLTNPRPFFAWAYECFPGAFNQDCLAEQLISENRSGAYAVVMNSKWGYVQVNTNWESFDSPTLRIHRYFWNSYFGKFRTNLGALIADGHEDSIWLLDRPLTRLCIFDTILFGDPATPMRGRGNNPTVTASASPTSGIAPLDVSFTARGSDVDGDTLSYSWTFGDGVTSTAQDPSHTYTVAGVYSATVTVSDGKGGTASTSVAITVNSASDVDPRADLNGDKVINVSDLQIVVGNFGKAVGSPGCDPRADADHDGVVSVLDLQIVVGNFGRACLSLTCVLWQVGIPGQASSVSSHRLIERLVICKRHLWFHWRLVSWTFLLCCSGAGRNCPISIASDDSYGKMGFGAQSLGGIPFF